MTLKSKIALISCVVILSSVQFLLKEKERKKTPNGIIQVIKYCYSYQLELEPLEHITSCPAAHHCIRTRNSSDFFFSILNPVNAAYLVFTDQMEHL